MKKIVIMLFVSIFSVMSFWETASAGPSIDQQHTGGGASVSINSSYGRFAQSFKPTMTGLSKVEIELTNITGSKSISVAIRHKVGTVWDEGNVATVNNQVVTNGWNTFDFEDITVLTGANDYYGIWTTCLQDGPQWKYNAGPSTYDKGFAIWQNTDLLDADYNFKTWGTDPVEMVDEQDISEQQNSSPEDNGGVPANTSTSSNEAPSTAVSSSIEKPTELKAVYTDSLKLSWKASKTTDIDGYLVFRSEIKGKSYTKIGTVEKNTLEYVDQTAQASKTYYYVVRANKGSSQSASSNEASIAVPENAAPIAPQNLKVNLVSSSFINATWDKNPESNISFYTVTLYLNGKEVETRKVDAGRTNCLFTGLEPDSDYTVKITANNTLDKSSPPGRDDQKN